MPELLEKGPAVTVATSGSHHLFKNLPNHERVSEFTQGRGKKKKMKESEEKEVWTHSGSSPSHIEPHPSASKLADKTRASKQVQKYFVCAANRGGHPIDIKNPEDMLLRGCPSQCFLEAAVGSQS